MSIFGLLLHPLRTTKVPLGVNYYLGDYQLPSDRGLGQHFVFPPRTIHFYSTPAVATSSLHRPLNDFRAHLATITATSTATTLFDKLSTQNYFKRHISSLLDSLLFSSSLLCFLILSLTTAFMLPAVQQKPAMAGRDSRLKKLKQLYSAGDEKKKVVWKRLCCASRESRPPEISFFRTLFVPC